MAGQRPYQHLPAPARRLGRRACCRSRATSPRASSARPRRSSTWLRASRWCRPRSPTSSSFTAAPFALRTAREAFVRQCAAALGETETARRARAAAAGRSWRALPGTPSSRRWIAEIEKVLPEGLAARGRAAVRGPGCQARAAAAAERRRRPGHRRRPDRPFRRVSPGSHGRTLLEANATVGGWCRSLEDGGFTFDHAGHIMFSQRPVGASTSTRSCSGDKCTGRTARRGSTATAPIPAIRSRARSRAAAEGDERVHHGRHRGALRQLAVDGERSRVDERTATAVPRRAPQGAERLLRRRHRSRRAGATVSAHAGAPPRELRGVHLPHLGRGIAKHFAFPTTASCGRCR